MSQLGPDCDCCFSETRGGYTVNCNGQSTHTFCYECVSSYMATGMEKGRIVLHCIQKRACSGMLVLQDVISLMKSAADKFSDDQTDPQLSSCFGTIVNCSKCDRRIRKLAFYNYVSCECGTVVCYECGQEITMNIRRHSCGPTNTDREPKWFVSSTRIINPDGSRRSRARSIAASFENTTTTLVIRNPLDEDTQSNQRYPNNSSGVEQSLGRMIWED